MALDSFNSTYPLGYYEVGSCYSFYLWHKGSHHRDATDNEIKAFSKVLDKCYSENKRIMYDGDSIYNKDLVRAAGVVIDEGQLAGSRDYKAYLDVMFKDDEGGYFVSRFGVDGFNAVLNDKEEHLPGTVVVSEIPGNWKEMKRVAGVEPVSPKGGARKSGKVSGPTEVPESGPTAVNESGPVEVKEAGPTEVI